MAKVRYICLPVSCLLFLLHRFYKQKGPIRSPDMANTCCPQYTIRLDALRFDPGKDKKMRYVINRWKRYIIEGIKPGETAVDAGMEKGKGQGGKKNRYGATDVNSRTPADLSMSR